GEDRVGGTVRAHARARKTLRRARGHRAARARPAALARRHHGFCGRAPAPRRGRGGGLTRGMATIRPFRPDDIPDFVALRRRSFSRSERPAAAALADYFEHVFFRNPWRDEALPSLVYVDPSGRPLGFLSCR